MRLIVAQQQSMSAEGAANKRGRSAMSRVSSVSYLVASDVRIQNGGTMQTNVHRSEQGTLKPWQQKHLTTIKVLV